ncbi:MAG: hypothetical protein AAF975_02770 [Spirochaetota bacterium]
MKAQRFLCGKCGVASSLEEGSCPSCGARFGPLIYCSQCRYEAREDAFGDGCPRCGYMSDKAKNEIRLGSGLNWFILALVISVLLVLIWRWLYNRGIFLP